MARPITNSQIVALRLFRFDSWLARLMAIMAEARLTMAKIEICTAESAQT